MAFEDLLHSLTQRAESETAALLAAARDQAAVLRRESDHRCAERSAAVLRDRTRAVALDTERLVADSVRLQRLGELAARARARDRVLSVVRAGLTRAAERADYRASLPARFASAQSVIGDVPARLRCAPALAPLLAPLASPYPHLRLDADPAIAGGFTIESEDGRVLVDETLEQRLGNDAAAVAQLALRSLDVVP